MAQLALPAHTFGVASQESDDVSSILEPHTFHEAHLLSS